MIDILHIIPGKKRESTTGWWSFNGPCCIHRGHNADRRGRAGVIFTDQPDFTYNCFNCGFKAGWRRGWRLTANTRLLLSWCGLDALTIDRLNLESLRHDAGMGNTQPQTALLPQFETRQLPDGARPIDPLVDSVHIEYLHSRGLSHNDYPFLVVDGEARQRIIIPYYWYGKIVGYTSRFYDGRHPKYVSEQQRGYVFNMDAIQREAQVVILVEGQFDAISIGGCAYMGSTINDIQAQLINNTGKQIVVVPDRDSSGLSVCDDVLNRGWSVSIPPWPRHIKDVNDAVKQWGRLVTVMSILEHRTSSRIKMEIARRKLT